MTDPVNFTREDADNGVIRVAFTGEELRNLIFNYSIPLLADGAPQISTLEHEIWRKLTTAEAMVIDIETRQARRLSASAQYYAIRQLLNDLLDWEASMGGFEAPVWDRARAFRDNLFATIHDALTRRKR